MAGACIRRRQRKGRIAYLASVDLGKDPVTGKRRERAETFATKREAQAAIARWQTELERGAFVDRSSETVGDFLRYWMETYVKHNCRENTFVQYGYTVYGHLIPGLGGICLQKLTPAQVQKFYADKRSSGTGDRTVQCCHLRLHQALDMALKLGMVARNVADAVPSPRVESNTMETWMPDEIGRFLAEAEQSHYGPIWLVLATTGMRRGEALGLRWQDVDWMHNRVTIRQTMVMVNGRRHFSQPKSKSSHRQVPLAPVVMVALRKHRDRQQEQQLKIAGAWHDHDLVFPTEVGTPVNARNLDREYHRLIARARVPYIPIHGIRHTVATLAIASGQDIRTLADLLGHAKTSVTTDIYAHVLPHRKVELSDAITNIVLGTNT